MKDIFITLSSDNASNGRNHTRSKLIVRKGSAVAGVLARLLDDDKPLTVWEAIDAFPTARLDVAVRTLRKYGWPIERVEFWVRSPSNGSYFWFEGYRLPQAAVNAARGNPNLETWIESVKMAQARVRAVNKAKAAALNTYRFGTDPAVVQEVARRLNYSQWGDQ